MSPSPDIPNLAVFRVSSPGGPFEENDTLSAAFGTSPICRLVRHGLRIPAGDGVPGATLIPEAISVSVVIPAGPYATGEELVLSFVDPTIARIHTGSRATLEPVAPLPAAPAESISVREVTSRAALPETTGVRTRLAWSADRARRFVQLSDKLFTVDRLGWYRHALAMRLLVPDEMSCGDPGADATLASHLRALRASAVETLGHPLLAAFMPNFNVTPEWLDTLDDPTAVRSVAAIRETVRDRASTEPALWSSSDPGWTEGEITRTELEIAPATSVEAFLPLLIANVSPLEPVHEKLTDYRRALIELFGQTAGSAEAVRLSQMAQPNHTLDDRLWQLVAAVGGCFGGLAVAS